MARFRSFRRLLPVAVLSALMAACTPAPALDPEPASVAQQHPSQVPAADLQLGQAHTVTRQNDITAYRIGENTGTETCYTTEHELTTCMVVWLQIQVLEGSYRTGGHEIKFQDDTGLIYDEIPSTAEAQPSFADKQILAGQTNEGWFSVYAPEEKMKTGYIVLTEDLMIEPIARWKVSL